MTKKKVKAKTYVALLIDASSSMSGIKLQAKKSFNDLLQSVTFNAKGTDTHVCVIDFGARHEEAARLWSPHILCQPTSVKNVISLDKYEPMGNTPLYDAVGMAIELLKQQPGADDPTTSFLVMTVTDGEENASQKWSATDIYRVTRNLQATNRWTFTYQLPVGYALKFSRMSGVPIENCREWEGTIQGMVETTVATQSAVSSYMAMRGVGGQSTSSFYVSPDLSKVTPKQVHAKLDDLSDKFKLVTADKESVIQPLVESKTKKEYVIGQAYYQLMKTEKVQPTKRVLIMEKGKKAVWGGKAARDLIGLPDNVIAKVTPGNHASYDIYLQSASVNRKLPRGTKILIDLTAKKGIKPTWDHTAVSPLGVSI